MSSVHVGMFEGIMLQHRRWLLRWLCVISQRRLLVLSKIWVVKCLCDLMKHIFLTITQIKLLVSWCCWSQNIPFYISVQAWTINKIKPVVTTSIVRQLFTSAWRISRSSSVSLFSTMIGLCCCSPLQLIMTSGVIFFFRCRRCCITTPGITASATAASSSCRTPASCWASL